MGNFITVAIAHDAVCRKGEEWLFHGIKGNSDAIDADGYDGSGTTAEAMRFLVKAIPVAIILFLLSALAYFAFFR